MIMKQKNNGNGVVTVDQLRRWGAFCYAMPEDARYGTVLENIGASLENSRNFRFVFDDGEIYIGNRGRGQARVGKLGYFHDISQELPRGFYMAVWAGSAAACEITSIIGKLYKRVGIEGLIAARPDDVNEIERALTSDGVDEPEVRIRTKSSAGGDDPDLVPAGV